jgi:hypothetical protein
VATEPTSEPGPAERHRALQAEAVGLEAEAQRRLLAGDANGARAAYRSAAERYRASWEVAPPGGYGRLIGMLKAALIAGEAAAEARYTREAIGPEGATPASWYALAVASLAQGDDAVAVRAATEMRAGGPPFERAAAALEALAANEGAAYREAIEAVVRDFEGREEHLTGVPVADTALMLERLAEARGVAARPSSPLMPALP